MLYCEKCMMLCDEKKCPNCGIEKLRVPKENDPVFLMTKEGIWSGGIEEILKENSIPCLKQGIQGTALTIKMGDITETYQFFVPFGAYEKSKELLRHLF